MFNMSSECKVTRAANAATVATTDVVGSTIDMEGYESILFIAQFGAITDGTPALKAGQGALSDGSDAADLAGTSTALAITDDNACAMLDLVRPQKRYITPTVVRGGATGAVLNGIIAIQYNARHKPTTQDSTVAKTELHVSPAEGTA